jgi:hypothetical protein
MVQVSQPTSPPSAPRATSQPRIEAPSDSVIASPSISVRHPRQQRTFPKRFIIGGADIKRAFEQLRDEQAYALVARQRHIRHVRLTIEHTSPECDRHSGLSQLLHCFMQRRRPRAQQPPRVEIYIDYTSDGEQWNGSGCDSTDKPSVRIVKEFVRQLLGGASAGYDMLDSRRLVNDRALSRQEHGLVKIQIVQATFCALQQNM